MHLVEVLWLAISIIVLSMSNNNNLHLAYNIKPFKYEPYVLEHKYDSNGKYINGSCFMYVIIKSLVGNVFTFRVMLMNGRILTAEVPFSALNTLTSKALAKLVGAGNLNKPTTKQMYMLLVIK